MGAGKYQEPPLTLSTTCSQCWGAPIQLFGQHPPGSDQLQGAVPLRLQVKDAARHHLLPSPAAPQRAWVPLGALAVAGAVLGAALLSSLRSDMVSVLGSYYYDDGCEPCGTDTFSREPFIVKFSSPTTREQSRHWGMPRPGTESPPCRAEPSIGGLQPSTRVPPMDAQGSYVPAQHGQQCLLFPTLCHLLSITSHHLSSPTMCSLLLCTISHLQMLPIVSCIPLSATSHLVPYPTICFLWQGAISHHLPSPIPSISHHVPFPTLFHCLPHAITSTS